MVKKIGIAAVVVVGALLLLNTTLGGVGWKKAKALFDKQISPETKLELIKEQVANLNKEEKVYISKVAEETVAVRKMKREVAAAEDGQKKMFSDILIMKKDLESDNKNFVYDGETYPRERIEKKLARDWDSYKRGQDSLKQLRDQLDARERALTAAETRLKEFQDKRRELETEVVQLETELKTLQAAKSNSKIDFDDSKLGEIKKQMAEFKDKMDQERVMLEMEGKYTTDNIRVDRKEPNKADAVKEIDEFVKNGNKLPEKKADETNKTVEK